MEITDLKKYLNDVLDREKALFTAHQIYNDIQRRKQYAYRMHESITMPSRPSEYSYNSTYLNETVKTIFSLIVTLGVIGVVGFFFSYNVTAFSTSLITVIIVGVIWGVLKILDEIRKDRLIRQQNKGFENDYRNAENYLYEVRNYQSLLILEFDKRERETVNLINETQSALNALYSFNIVFEKYRYFVAIASFCEYLQSGRCYSLEGHEGAYNIYEIELRQNIIINQLNIVLNELQKIRNSQYLLYSAINESNSLLKNISNDIDNMNNELRAVVTSSTMNAYYAKETARNTKLLVDINRGELVDRRGRYVRE